MDTITEISETNISEYYKNKKTNEISLSVTVTVFITLEFMKNLPVKMLKHTMVRKERHILYI